MTINLMLWLWSIYDVVVVVDADDDIDDDDSNPLKRDVNKYSRLHYRQQQPPNK